MNYEKSKVLLKKINALHEAMSHGDENDSLERDLFLQYLRNLYEVVSNNGPFVGSVGQIHKKVEPVTQVRSRPIVEKITPPETKVAVPNVTPVQKIVEDVLPKPPMSVISDNLKSLFEESDESFDSSHRLGGQIKNIGKSMGINEKILTINELFGGKQPLFDETIADLNMAKNFEEAKAILAKGVATKMEWTEGARRGKAIHFIHLVRRKYSD